MAQSVFRLPVAVMVAGAESKSLDERLSEAIERAAGAA
ncbi:hypothetical protein J2X50_000152 [Aminobacter sp. BE322]